MDKSFIIIYNQWRYLKKETMSQKAEEIQHLLTEVIIQEKIEECFHALLLVESRGRLFIDRSAAKAMGFGDDSFVLFYHPLEVDKSASVIKSTAIATGNFLTNQIVFRSYEKLVEPKPMAAEIPLFKRFFRNMRFQVTDEEPEEIPEEEVVVND